MKIWELRNGLVNDVAMLVSQGDDQDMVSEEQFGGDGSPLAWSDRPVLEVFVDKRRKKPKPRADVSPFIPGALVLNERARNVLGDFLGRFGQLLEVDVEGDAEYFYNVTNVVSCIDTLRSSKRASGAIAKEVFVDSALPRDAAIFKDPRTAPSRIYVNDAGKLDLERLIAEAGITGIAFSEIVAD